MKHGIITFILRRRSYLKVLGSTIDAAVARKHPVIFCVAEEAKEPFWPGDFARWPMATIEDGTARSWETGRIRVGLAGDGLLGSPDVGVCSWYDNILTWPHAGPTICYLSQWHRQLHWTCCMDRPSLDQHQIDRILQQPIVGWTMADHRALLQPATVFPYILLFTMKRRVPEPFRRSLRGRFWYWEEIRKWYTVAQEGGRVLVFKTRAKHGDPWWLSHYGQRISDSCMYPSTSLHLLQHALFAVHYESGAGAEMRLMNVPETCIRPPRGHLNHLPGQDTLYQELLGSSLPRAEYMQKFFTYDDCKAGERIMDVVEQKL